MMVTCPKCEKQYNVDDEFAGRRVRCQGCGGEFTIPSQVESSSAAPTEVQPKKCDNVLSSKTENDKKPHDRVVRTLTWTATIAFCVVAALGIVCVLEGDVQKPIKHLMSIGFVVSVACICLLSMRIYSFRKFLYPITLAGYSMTILAGILNIVAICSDFELSKSDMKLTVGISIPPVILAILPLFLYSKLQSKHRWIQIVTAIGMGYVALQLECLIFITDSQWNKFDSTASILTLLGMVSIPMLSLLNNYDTSQKENTDDQKSMQ